MKPYILLMNHDGEIKALVSTLPYSHYRGPSCIYGLSMLEVHLAFCLALGGQEALDR